MAQLLRDLAPSPDVELAWNPEFLREGFAVAGHAAPGPAGVRRRTPSGPRPRLRAAFAPVIEAGHAGRRHRLRHRRAGQGRRELLPGHQDLLHQRDGRGLRGHRCGRHPAGRRDRPRRRGSAAASSTPASASAAAACPRTSGRSSPAPASSASTRRCRSCARSTRSTCVAGPAPSSSASICVDGSYRGIRGRGAGCGVQAQLRRHPRLARPSTSPPRSAAAALTSSSTTRRRWTTPVACIRSWTTPSRSTTRWTGADLVLLLTEWDEFRAMDPVEIGRIVRHAQHRRRPQRARPGALARGRLALSSPRPSLTQVSS